MTKKIYLAGGCFWGVQEYFRRTKRIIKSTVGYANCKPEFKNPTYKEVCSGLTGAVETVEIIYDDQIINLEEIIDLFLKVVDPTTLNYQANDKGTQYRSGFYFVDEADETIIKSKLAQAQGRYSKPIVTEVLKLQNYFEAEEYHQDYLVKNPSGYCHIKFD
ncbi:peptide-methionine (S)-S-oxide reductase MsrA [Mycoplasma bradburyae]|uniref:Peptide methionine sulfoxide reductase MsrA n=1 Tax=Mycoplasma bradburyae TaxID=2963128 RepID=A0AAW6HRS5_9MOLU|nr:peptide-methionine (S)-S-oxide reductase MsrA [Mycoplasma bradburyae]MDC4163191.1 peptide-methionine (S)-S-oxide reductase MsrA [Mycoplasma bradburyae]MDC4182506.1 peptide-methionine (S)-S-oxide reductase MsrA [Mycoplasma bradburyae]MDC4183179.1 peptide-methionine (S)-S-oxide reductase MsrA [Mycoplasma bradburyae]MDC4183988.1 peptide-methionine (S)-S-oxide reductase MsrA [Mycoplasma bradburyae]UTS70831.1 peptide-methionine (S)-S-oxide reductase MsrA [Mycoplasma bradburyae]